MNRGRASTYRPFARAGLVFAIVTAGVLTASSIPAAAATTIGSPTATTGIGCPVNMDTVQLSAAGISYSVPAGGGFITSWSTTANVNLGPAGLLVWRPTGTANTYTLVAATTTMPLTLGLNTFNLTAPGIAVQAGDVLGLRSVGKTDCIAQAGSGNLMGYRGPTSGTAPVTFTTDPLALTLNVSATVGTTTPPSGGTPPPTGGTPPPTGGGTGDSTSGSGEQQSGDQHEAEGSEPDDNGRATHPTHPKHPAKPHKDESTQKQHASTDSEKHTGHSDVQRGELFKADR